MLPRFSSSILPAGVRALRSALLTGLFAALSLPSAHAAGLLGQSFTVSGTGELTLVSVTFMDVGFASSPAFGTPGVLNIFGASAGLASASTTPTSVGYDNATPVLFSSSSYVTDGGLTTFTFSGATISAGVEYYAIFDSETAFGIAGADYIAGGALIVGGATDSIYVGGADAAGFSVATASAVPEPSTYAAIFGACALGAAGIVRRRRAAAAKA